jgi:hypothetical protein
MSATGVFHRWFRYFRFLHILLFGENPNSTARCDDRWVLAVESFQNAIPTQSKEIPVLVKPGAPIREIDGPLSECLFNRGFSETNSTISIHSENL